MCIKMHRQPRFTFQSIQTMHLHLSHLKQSLFVLFTTETVQLIGSLPPTQGLPDFSHQERIYLLKVTLEMQNWYPGRQSNRSIWKWVILGAHIFGGPFGFHSQESSILPATQCSMWRQTVLLQQSRLIDPLTKLHVTSYDIGHLQVSKKVLNYFPIRLSYSHLPSSMWSATFSHHSHHSLPLRGKSYDRIGINMH